MKMEQTEYSETLEIKLYTPEKNPKENIRQDIDYLWCRCVELQKIQSTEYI
jgi:hypothetical protein